MYILTYRRISMIVTNIMGLLLLTYSILYYLDMIKIKELTWIPLLYSILILLVLPIVIYYSALNNYKTHFIFHERVTYEIDTSFIIIYGPSFYLQTSWEKTYKVIELNKWILFYQNKLNANIIHKDAIGNQLEELREIIKNKNIKYKLKK